jgi:hypothetical protein
MSTYELELGPSDGSVADLFKRLFVTAARGWIVPATEDEGRLDPETGYTEYDGPPRTAEILAELESGALPKVWCTLAVQLPKGRRMQRSVVLRDPERQPVAVLEVERDRLRLVFPGDPLPARRIPESRLEQERWDLAARLAREELAAVLERLGGAQGR